MSEEKKETLEDKLKALEETVSSLEKEDVSLEDAFTLYEKGIKLVKECEGEIDLVEKKVLALSEDGTYEFS